MLVKGRLSGENLQKHGDNMYTSVETEYKNFHNIRIFAFVWLSHELRSW